MKRQNSLGGRIDQDFNLAKPPLSVSGGIYRVRRVRQRKSFFLCGGVRQVEREESIQKVDGELVSVVKLGADEFWRFDEEMKKWEMGVQPEERAGWLPESDARYRNDVKEHKKKEYANAEREKEKIMIEDKYDHDVREKPLIRNTNTFTTYTRK